MIFRYKIEIISDIEQKIRKLLVNIAVAPFVGVWVEIRTMGVYEPNEKGSLPSWECGLKLKCQRTVIQQEIVAPFVGVWVEILLPYQNGINRSCRSLRGSVG